MLQLQLEASGKIPIEQAIPEKTVPNANHFALTHLVNESNVRAPETPSTPLLAHLETLGEIAGGLALITGVYARTAALLMVPILLGALLQHAPNGWVFSANGGGWEFPAFWAAASLASALIGPGAFALKLSFLPAEPFFHPERA